MGNKRHSPAGILTLDELAIYLRVAQAALQPLLDSGQIPGRQIGGEWRFLRAAVDDWLRAPAVPSAGIEVPAEGALRDLPSEGEEGAERGLPPAIQFVGAAAKNFSGLVAAASG